MRRGEVSGGERRWELVEDRTRLLAAEHEVDRVRRRLRIRATQVTVFPDLRQA